MTNTPNTPNTPANQPANQPPAQPALPAADLIAQRGKNREGVRALGLEPYGSRSENILTSTAARATYDEAADKDHQANGKTPGYIDTRPTVKVAGRIVLLRDNGKLIWLNVRDHAGDIQVAISQRDCDATAFSFAKLTDMGDVIVAEGRLMRTKTGEVTVWASSIQPAAKCMVPPPEKHAGLSDVELRYRQRYLDLWVNPDTAKVFEQRSTIVSTVRTFMHSRGYMEVETPMLQSLAGGAAARPFVTKMNALDINLFMRVAPELYLKRLLVGGFPKVFEVNRNFRNEGLDKQHNPEFTMLEAYHAFGDVETVMEMTESLIRACATVLCCNAGSALSSQGGDAILPFGDLSINYSKPFARRSYSDLFEKAWGFSMLDTAKVKATLAQRMPKHAAAIANMDPILAVNELFEDKEKGGEAQLDHSTPTFITDYPAAISPLTRPKRDNPMLADRADLFIAGMEIAPHYTELNDPDIQEAKFREQLTGIDAEKNAEENTYRTMDHDFLRALRVGMPPAGGMGLGIDRLTMLLTNQRTIRDVVLFPLMRPE
ncbi:lysine--tRNA ligase [Phycisphaerae bacterium]|nr:lysine--tRNA ligase [Phycisphaerae bacterium]